MFYLIRDDQRTIVESYDRAVALVARGWGLTTRVHYMALWMTDDNERLQQLIAAARWVPLAERMMGGHYSF